MILAQNNLITEIFNKGGVLYPMFGLLLYKYIIYTLWYTNIDWIIF